MSYGLSFLLFGTIGLLFNYLMRGNKNQAQPAPPVASFSEDSLPICEEAATIPVIFGTVELGQSNLVGYGGYRVEEVVLAKRKIGRKYGIVGKKIYQEDKANKCRISMHLVLGLGSFDNVQRIFFDDKVVFGGVWTKHRSWKEIDGSDDGNDDTANSAGGDIKSSIGDTYKENGTGEYHNLYYDNDYLMQNRSIEIVAEAIYGGSYKEGGVQGRVDLMLGLADQQVNPDLKKVIAKGGACPAFRGVTSLYFHDFYFGTQPNMKPIKFLVSRVQRTFYGQSQWHLSKAKIGADMNPAHIIREILVSPIPDWGMNLSETLIDEASFRAAADQLYDEDFGLSFVWDKEGTTSNFLEVVCDHINAIIITDRTTQQRKLKLIRDDYDFNSLRVLTYDEVKSVMAYNMTEPVDLHNHVVVNYWDRRARSKGSITKSNPAMYDIVRTINSKSKNYDGCKRYELAERLAVRDLKMLSTPLSKIKLQCNRLAFNLELGQVIRVKLEYDIIEDVAYRINKLTYDENCNYVTVEAIQDIFGLPKYTPAPAPNIITPSAEPTNAKNVIIIEASYLDIVRSQQDKNVNNAYSHLQVFAEKNYIETNYTLLAKTNEDFIIQGVGQFTNGQAKLKEKIDKQATTLKVTSFVDLSELDVLQLNNERMLIVSIDVQDGSISVLRGYEDTHPSDHPVNTPLYNLERAFFDSVPFDVGANVQLKLITNSASGATLPLAQATTYNTSINGRHSAPYPPQNIKLNGEYYPELITLKTDTLDANLTYFELSACGRNKEVLVNDININWYDERVIPSGAKYYYSIDGVVTKNEFSATNVPVKLYFKKAQLHNKVMKVWAEQNGKMCTYPFIITLKIA